MIRALSRRPAWLAIAWLAASGCTHEPQAAAAGPAASATAPATNASGGNDVPHGDHNPHHGGVVFMRGEMHFEAVLDRAGHHQLYFTDAVRQDLPAAVAKDVSIAVSRPGRDPETIPAHIDDTGESWIADGKPVDGNDATARISFVTSDGPYWIDVPFIARR